MFFTRYIVTVQRTARSRRNRFFIIRWNAVVRNAYKKPWRRKQQKKKKMKRNEAKQKPKTRTSERKKSGHKFLSFLVYYYILYYYINEHMGDVPHVVLIILMSPLTKTLKNTS